MSNNDKSKDYTVSFTSKKEDSPWWAKDISKVLRPEARKLLEEYAEIPPDQVINRISEARERAWEIAPYASIGGLTWLNAYIVIHISHSTILEKVRNGGRMLDCGCSFAPDLRMLAHEGAPTENMYGFDIEGGFFPQAYSFYNDGSKFQGKFQVADAWAEPSPLAHLQGKMDIIWCSKFLHLYTRERQIEMAVRLIRLLRPCRGSIFAGSQNGFPGSLDQAVGAVGFPGMSSTFFLGDEKDIREMWDEVAQRTGTKWEVEARLLDLRSIGWHVDDGSEYSARVGYNLQWAATLVEPAEER